MSENIFTMCKYCTFISLPIILLVLQTFSLTGSCLLFLSYDLNTVQRNKLNLCYPSYIMLPKKSKYNVWWHFNTKNKYESECVTCSKVLKCGGGSTSSL